MCVILRALMQNKDVRLEARLGYVHYAPFFTLMGTVVCKMNFILYLVRVEMSDQEHKSFRKVFPEGNRFPIDF